MFSIAKTGAVGWAVVMAMVTTARSDDTKSWGLEGSLGASRIGMTLVLANGEVRPGSHYFYQKYLKDIPLTGTVGNEIVLHEPGGGTFTLHAEGGDATPQDLENSTSLRGAWNGGGKTFPATLGLGSIATFAPGHRYADASDVSDAAFEAQVQGFTAGIMAGDRAAAMRHVAFPLRVNTGEGHFFTVETPAQLDAAWPRVFSAAWIAALAKEPPHDMGTIQDQVALGAGLAFFDRKGKLSIVNAM